MQTRGTGYMFRRPYYSLKSRLNGRAFLHAVVERLSSCDKWGNEVGVDSCLLGFQPDRPTPPSIAFADVLIARVPAKEHVN